MKFADKWMDLEKVILSEVIEGRGITEYRGNNGEMGGQQGRRERDGYRE